MTLHTGRLITLLYAAMSIIFISCEDSNPPQTSPEGKGLVMCAMQSEIVVKAASAAADGFDDYNFRFVGVDGYATSEYMRYGDVQWPMPWYFGVFRLQAESCTAEQAETLRGRLRYEGISTPFSVVNDRVATASVVCKVANVQVKVNFDDTMYEAFDDYKLTVTSVSIPPAEDGSEIEDGSEEGDGSGEETEEEEFVPEVYRTLDFTPFELSGYYNLQSKPVGLGYVLYVKMPEAEEFIPVAEGHFSTGTSEEPAMLNGGDVVTFNVEYTGTVTVTDGIKFIVEGTKHAVGNGLTLEKYDNGVVTEDK